MATFLFTTLPTNDLGLLTRSLPIARELHSRGHLVRFCSPAAAPRRLIADGGFENVLPDHPLYELLSGPQTLAGALAYLRSGGWRRRHPHLLGLLHELLPALPLRRAPPSDDVWSMDHAGALMGMLDPGFVRANCQALAEVVAASDPDVVVDFWNPFAVAATRAAGKPLVTVIQADAHPLGRGFVWWKPAPVPPPPSPAPVVSRVLAELGLPGVSRLEELCLGDLTLVVGSPETDPLPANADVTYLGLLLWEQQGARLPAWTEELGRGRPLVFIYSGNPRYGFAGRSLDSAVVIEACIDALAGEELDAVLTTGHHRLPPELPPLPHNFRHEPYLPGLAMAARCDLLIHHGGYGSCQTGLHAGKPAVILPTYSERESNARKLAALGAVEVVEVARHRGRKSVDAGALRAAVRRVLATPSYGERARALGDSLRACAQPRGEGCFELEGAGRTERTAAETVCAAALRGPSAECARDARELIRRRPRLVGAANRFVGQLGKDVLQCELRGRPPDELQELPVKPDRTWRAQPMAEAERSLRTLGVAGRVAGHELEGPLRLHREDRAVVPARKRMGVAVWLGRVEEKHVVGVGEDRLTLARPAEDPFADQDDAVRGVGLLETFRLDMGAAAEVHDRDPQRFEQVPSCVRHTLLGGWRRTHGLKSIRRGSPRGSHSMGSRLAQEASSGGWRTGLDSTASGPD